MIFSERLLNQTVTLTVSTNPASATCTLTYNGNSYTSKTAIVPKGTVISYSIYQATYGTTTGSITMDKDKTLTCTGTYSTGTSYLDTAWSSPNNLTSNGTLGGSSFAVQADSEWNNQGIVYHAWNAFDGNITTDGKRWVSSKTSSKLSTDPAYLIIYNPTPVKLTSITVRNPKSWATGFSSGSVQGSSNNSSYSSIKTWTNSIGNKDTTWTISVNSSSYYKYWKLVITGNSTNSYRPQAQELYYSGYVQSQSTSYSYYWDKSIT